MEVALSRPEYVPAGHGRQAISLCAPVKGWYVPGGQLWHEVTDVAPVALPQVPAGQPRH